MKTIATLYIFFFACYVSINQFFLPSTVLCKSIDDEPYYLRLSVTEYSSGILTGMNSDAYGDYRTLSSLPFRKRMMHLCTKDTCSVR